MWYFSNKRAFSSCNNEKYIVSTKKTAQANERAYILNDDALLSRVIIQLHFAEYK